MIASSILSKDEADFCLVSGLVNVKSKTGVQVARRAVFAEGRAAWIHRGFFMVHDDGVENATLSLQSNSVPTATMSRGEHRATIGMFD